MCAEYQFFILEASGKQKTKEKKLWRCMWYEQNYEKLIIFLKKDLAIKKSLKWITVHINVLCIRK